MNKIRVAIIHNGADSSVKYANQLNEQLTDEAVVVDVHDPRPIRLALPIRAVPNVAVILFADSLEETPDIESVLRQLELIKNLDEVDQIVAEISESGSLTKASTAMAKKLFTT